MHIKVHNGHAFHTVCLLQSSHRNRNVIEGAESFPIIGKRVMRTTSQVHRDAVLQCGFAGLAGAAHHAKGAFDKRFTPGQAQATLRS